LLYKYLPKNLFARPKQGFGIPIKFWLKSSLKEWAENLLYEDNKYTDYLNLNYLRKEWKKYLSDDKNINDSFIWNNLIFLAWVRKNNDYFL
jgi:hypothetical protein